MRSTRILPNFDYSKYYHASWVYENVYLVTILAYLASLFIGVLFYRFINGWDIYTSYFFATQVQFGEMFGIPAEDTSYSRVFTLMYYLWSSTLFAGAVGAFSAHIVARAIESERRRNLRINIGKSDKSDKIGWKSHKSKYITILCSISWMIIGILYGIIFEKNSLFDSIYFAVAIISCTGIPMKSFCSGTYSKLCRFEPHQAIFLGIYITIGVPLYSLTMGQFTGLIVERAIRHSELQILTRKLTEDDYSLVMDICRSETTRKPKQHKRPTNKRTHEESQLYSHENHNHKIILSEFIILELMRLKRFNEDDIVEIKQLFSYLDFNRNGKIDAKLLTQQSFSFSRSKMNLFQNMNMTLNIDIDNENEATHLNVDNNNNETDDLISPHDHYNHVVIAARKELNNNAKIELLSNPNSNSNEQATELNNRLSFNQTDLIDNQIL